MARNKAQKGVKKASQKRLELHIESIKLLANEATKSARKLAAKSNILDLISKVLEPMEIDPEYLNQQPKTLKNVMNLKATSIDNELTNLAEDSQKEI